MSNPRSILSSLALLSIIVRDRRASKRLNAASVNGPASQHLGGPFQENQFHPSYYSRSILILPTGAGFVAAGPCWSSRLSLFLRDASILVVLSVVRFTDIASASI